MWTDIVQALGVGFAIPITVWGVIKLFIRDRKREAEVESLINMAKSQGQLVAEMQRQLSEFSKQTREMEYQSVVMNESNELLKEQISLQAQALCNDASYKANMQILEISKRKAENRPYFIFSTGHSAGFSGDFSVNLKNVGKTAYFKKIVDQDSNTVISIPLFPKEDRMIENGQEITIGGSIKDSKSNINLTDYDFTFEFADIEGVKYQQTLTKKNNGSGYAVSKPVEINP